MMRRARVLAVAVVAIVLAIPLLPGPGVFIIMAALADVHDAFQRPSGSQPSAAGFPPAATAGPFRKPHETLDQRGAAAGGRRVA